MHFWKKHAGFDMDTLKIFKLYSNPSIKLHDQAALNSLILNFHYSLKNLSS